MIKRAMITILITITPQHECLHIPFEKRLNKVHLSSVTITYTVKMQSIFVKQILAFQALTGVTSGFIRALAKLRISDKVTSPLVPE